MFKQLLCSEQKAEPRILEATRTSGRLKDILDHWSMNFEKKICLKFLTELDYERVDILIFEKSAKKIKFKSSEPKKQFF